MTPAVETKIGITEKGEAMNPVTKVHLSLNVKDVARSIAFYEAFFGTAVHKRRPGYANFDLTTPALKLALNEAEPTTGGRSRLDHLGMVVNSKAEVDAARERLTASGLVSFDEGDTVCCYARQDKVWVTDPDGNSWEVYVILDDMEDEHEQNGTTTESMPRSVPLAVAGCCGGDVPADPRGGCCR